MMPAKRIFILGTAARGGIRSVIEAYEAAGFYSPGRARFVPTHVEGGMAARLMAAARAYILVALNLAANRVALLHMHMSMRGSFWRKFLFLLMGRMLRVPVIVHLHGSEFAEFYDGSRAWVRAAVRYLFDHADGIVVLSTYWKDFVNKLTSRQVTVIGNFVPDRYDPQRADRERNIRHALFLGQFGERKGIYDLLPVFAGLAGRFPDARLYCGGNGQVDEVRAQVHKLGADASIYVPGWVGGGEKESLLHACGLFVLPSRNEGLPMAIIEAMSYAMPIVSTTVGGIPELVDTENGRLVTPGDRDGLSQALADLLSCDDATLKAMGAVSRARYLRNYSPASCMEAMRALYASLGVEP